MADERDASEQPRLPGMTQRPVEEPRERQAPAWAWLVGGAVLAIGGVAALVAMVATGFLLPATSGIATVLVPAGIVVLARGVVLHRRRARR